MNPQFFAASVFYGGISTVSRGNRVTGGNEDNANNGEQRYRFRPGNRLDLPFVLQLSFLISPPHPSSSSPSSSTLPPHAY